MDKGIGIIGGYSEIGRHCAAVIAAAVSCPVYIAGRDKEKAVHTAAGIPNARGMQLDIYNQQELDEFCSRCQVVINCAGPSTVILDRIAMAALHHHCHYIDIGGYDVLFDLMKEKREAITSAGLHFILSAGWIPGVSGIFPMYLTQLAEQQWKEIHSLEIFISGKEKWSYGSCRDMVWAMFEDFSGVFEHGKWVKKNVFTNTRKVILPMPLSKQLAYPMFNNQLKEFSLKKSYPLVAEYMGSAEFSISTTLLIMYIKLFLKGNKEKAARLFQKAINRDMIHAEPAGIVHVLLKNSQGGRLEGTLFTADNNRLTGTAPALATIMLLNKTLCAPGLRYLCEAVKPEEFMRLLEQQGFSFSVTYH